MPPVTVVIPCFNEAGRLSDRDVGALVEDGGVGVLLVDDGSTDATPRLLEEIAAGRGPAVGVLRLPTNAGKAEAVRRGMLAALDAGASCVGYADADFAAPPAEILRLVDVHRTRGSAVVVGCRLARLGAEIDRSAVRHYVGRVFATLASWALRAPVYDTQCGAKLFAADAALREALARPFSSRWSFDVELLGRLMNAREAAGVPRTLGFVEVPLECWRDVPGSKLRLGAAFRAAIEVVRIGRTLRREAAVATRGVPSRTAMPVRAPNS